MKLAGSSRLIVVVVVVAVGRATAEGKAQPLDGFSGGRRLRRLNRTLFLALDDDDSDSDLLASRSLSCLSLSLFRQNQDEQPEMRTACVWDCGHPGDAHFARARAQRPSRKFPSLSAIGAHSKGAKSTLN